MGALLLCATLEENLADPPSLVGVKCGWPSSVTVVFLFVDMEGKEAPVML